MCVYVCVKVKANPSVSAGRTPEVSAVLQERFIQFSLQTGILADNIVILPKNGTSLIFHINASDKPLGTAHNFAHSPPNVCVFLQLSVPRSEESCCHPPFPALWHPRLSNLKSFIFSPQLRCCMASHSCTWDTDTQAFYFIPPDPDPHPDLTVSNSNISLQHHSGRTKGRWWTKDRACMGLWTLLVSFLYMWMFCKCWFCLLK